MLAKIISYGLCGIDGFPVVVETDVNNGLPKTEIVGLADTSVKESKERVWSALRNSGFVFPTSKITINLAPADKKKEGPYLDLPIAISILCATKQLSPAFAEGYVFVGELSLDGSIKQVNGILPILISARKKGYTKFIIPSGNSCEAQFIEGVSVYPVNCLVDVVDFLSGSLAINPVSIVDFGNYTQTNESVNDFASVKGQASAKRALEIAAAGGHNVLMIGPPGSGKTLLAKCFPSILPSMTFEEALEVTKIHSIAGVLNKNTGIVVNRPFRSPHHTASTISLTGGNKNSKPGEISLAHNGVLFLDEMPEYSRATLEALRQPLEDGVITVARANQTIIYPSNFTLIASMNPCPCGNYGSKTAVCKCAPGAIHKYLSKISGPLMDRIDLHVEVDGITYDELSSSTQSESSADIKKRVEMARNIQTNRFSDAKIYSNSKMNIRQTKKYCSLSQECEDLLKMAFEKLNLSARAHDRILKVARTIADLDGAESITPQHIAEAIQYRSLDRKYWI